MPIYIRVREAFDCYYRLDQLCYYDDAPDDPVPPPGQRRPPIRQPTRPPRRQPNRLPAAPPIDRRIRRASRRYIDLVRLAQPPDGQLFVNRAIHRVNETGERVNDAGEPLGDQHDEAELADIDGGEIIRDGGLLIVLNDEQANDDLDRALDIIEARVAQAEAEGVPYNNVRNAQQPSNDIGGQAGAVQDENDQAVAENDAPNADDDNAHALQQPNDDVQERPVVIDEENEDVKAPENVPREAEEDPLKEDQPVKCEGCGDMNVQGARIHRPIDRKTYLRAVQILKTMSKSKRSEMRQKNYRREQWQTMKQKMEMYRKQWSSESNGQKNGLQVSRSEEKEKVQSVDDQIDLLMVGVQAIAIAKKGTVKRISDQEREAEE